MLKSLIKNQKQMRNRFSAFCSDDFLIQNVKRWLKEHQEDYDGVTAEGWLTDHVGDVEEDAMVYCGTYGKYNDSWIGGMWIDIESFWDYDEFMDFCHAIHSDEKDPEIMFQDYQNFPREFYSESGMDEKDFNLIKEYCEFKGDEREAAEAYLRCKSVEDFSGFKECYEGKWENEEAFARHIAEECLQIPANLEAYFNYKRYAKELFSGDFTYWDGFVFNSSH